jgi:hypothetical protein
VPAGEQRGWLLGIPSAEDYGFDVRKRRPFAGRAAAVFDSILPSGSRGPRTAICVPAPSQMLGGVRGEMM